MLRPRAGGSSACRIKPTGSPAARPDRQDRRRAASDGLFRRCRKGNQSAAMSAERDLIILDGCTFFYSSENGDVEAEDAEGLFYRDVRHLSHWDVRVDG